MSTPAWVPSVEQVAAWIRARTRDRAGNELGTFTEHTRPTRAQVEEMLTQITDDWVGDTGGLPVDAPEALSRKATAWAAIEAAAMVELSYFPEQITSGRSSYTELRAMATSKREGLGMALAEYVNQGTVGPDAEVLGAYASFPDDPPILGLGTRW